MDSKDRLSTALRRGKPDRVPIVEPAIHPVVREALHPGMSYNDFIRELDLDMAFAEEVYNNKILAEDTQLNEWGVVIKNTREMIWFPADHPIKDAKALSAYKPPKADEAYRLNALWEVLDDFKDKRPVFFGMHDVFRFAHDLRGFDQLLVDFACDPELAGHLMDLSLEYNVSLAQIAIKAGADGIILEDDYAYNSGPFMSPMMFDEFILPRLTTLVQEIKSLNAFCIKHSDGNMTSLMESVISTGIDCVHPFEPVAGMDLGSAKAQWGNRICIMGNVDCGELMCHGRPEEVEEAVRQCIHDAGSGGGYILSSSNSTHSSVKPENFLAMVSAGKKYGKY